MLKRKNSKAFTLIEIIVVLVILGILATIALSSMFSWIEKSRASEFVLQTKDLFTKYDACFYQIGSSDAQHVNALQGCMGIFDPSSFTDIYFSKTVGNNFGWFGSYLEVAYGRNNINNSASLQTYTVSKGWGSPDAVQGYGGGFLVVWYSADFFISSLAGTHQVIGYGLYQ